jgi:excisionase family DNA binding protein
MTMAPTAEVLQVRKRTFTAEEARTELGISRSKFYEMVNQGQIKVVRAGKKILVPEWVIREFLQEESNAQVQ